MNLILLGPPGAGKGTQAVRIAKAFEIVHLSSGDILRAERKNKTDLGNKAQGYMDRGVLVPDNVILAMMMDHIDRPDAASGFVLDGFPRTVVQAERLDESLAENGKKINAVVNIQVSEDDVVKRLTGRLYCAKSGRTYHVDFSPPKSPGICDESGQPLLRRKDDEPEVVRQRLLTYRQETKPLVGYYRERGVLCVVDGSGAPDGVTEAIRKVCRPQ